jgi:hypothetical protein
MTLTLIVLAWMHPHLDDLLDLNSFVILDRETFLAWHAGYLHTSTVQWCCTLAYLLLTVVAWRAEDQPARATAADAGRQAPEEESAMTAGG